MSVTQGAEMLPRHGSGAATPRQQSDTPLIRISLPGAFPAVSPYLSQKLTRILVTKDGGTPRTIQEGCAEPRPRTHDDDQRSLLA